ncbi:MAG: right-handed parallel beta-helix repeat-containing protein [Armatimonadota bacterium]|nr:right-handed parallel beta-helix repeat-containing protein [Armatimonadota bacterium]
MVGSLISRHLLLAAFSLCAVLALSTSAYSAGGFSPDYKIADIGPGTESVDSSKYQRVCYVSQTTGSDRVGNGSRAKPWSTVGKAIAALSGAGPSKHCLLKVASGRYTGTTIAMRPYVDIYGGCDPKSWARDIFAHRSVLDGRGAGRVLIGADNSRLDGFVIRGGRTRGHGGAILCDRTSPEITNNVFTGNSTSEPKDYVRGLIHQVGSEGGAIACINAASPRIANNIFHGNTTDNGGGGAIASRNYSLPVIENNVIADNVTGTTDNNPDKKKRARSSNGGGISCSNALHTETTTSRIVNNLIINNRVGGNGDGGGIYCEYDSFPDIVGNAILGNSAEDDGGAIYVMKSSEPLISGNYIAGSKGGGAIRLSKEGRARIEGNVLALNVHGGVLIMDSWGIVANNTIVDNTDLGVACEKARPPLKPSIVKDNIIWGNANTSIAQGADELLILSNNVTQGESAAPAFLDDGLTGTLASTSLDRARFQTRMQLASGLENAEELVGRVIRVGEYWSVICAADSRSLTIWGEVRKPATFEIPKSYRLKE